MDKGGRGGVSQCGLYLQVRFNNIVIKSDNVDKEGGGKTLINPQNVDKNMCFLKVHKLWIKIRVFDPSLKAVCK